LQSGSIARRLFEQGSGPAPYGRARHMSEQSSAMGIGHAMTSEPGLIASLCETRAFRCGLGLETEQTKHALFVRDKDAPDVWSANLILRITARSEAEFAELREAAESFFVHCSYRHYEIDPLTPAFVGEFLASEAGLPQPSVLQMVLSGDCLSGTPSVTIRPVENAEDWLALRMLVFADHSEGARTHGKELSSEITDGIVDGYQRKEPQCRFFLAEFDSQVCGYGSGTYCPGEMGMIEDLFTLPSFRRRGVCSTLIRTVVEDLRKQGASDILIGPYADGEAKHLYSNLGFRTVCETHTVLQPVHGVSVTEI
jgi:ribosomal protein S18 acetylase RimI-like enzyme